MTTFLTTFLTTFFSPIYYKQTFSRFSMEEETIEEIKNKIVLKLNELNEILSKIIRRENEQEEFSIASSC